MIGYNHKNTTNECRNFLQEELLKEKMRKRSTQRRPVKEAHDESAQPSQELTRWGAEVSHFRWRIICFGGGTWRHG